MRTRRFIGKVTAVLALTVAGVACGNGGGYSDEFRDAFLQSCEQTSGGQTAYCECALNHLEANGPENEGDISVEDQTAAAEACAGELGG